jgi:hypothetical protein
VLPLLSFGVRGMELVDEMEELGFGTSFKFSLSFDLLLYIARKTYLLLSSLLTYGTHLDSFEALY